MQQDVFGGPGRFYQGNLVARAPDYVMRQIFGYTAVLPPPPRGSGGRYVEMTVPMGFQTVNGFSTTTVTGAAGGGGTAP